MYNDHLIQITAAVYGNLLNLFIASITNNKQNFNFLRFSFMSIRGGGLAKIMRDAMHGHSSFLVTANM